MVSGKLFFAVTGFVFLSASAGTRIVAADLLPGTDERRRGRGGSLRRLSRRLARQGFFVGGVLIAHVGQGRGFLDGRPLIHERRSMKDVPAATEQSKAISKALKAEGFRFVGPTTVYAFMQAMGLINDHVEDCVTRAQVERARKTFKRPGR